MVKIANQVGVTEDITLQNGVDVTLKSLPIARLRRFMKAWNKFGKPVGTHVEDGEEVPNEWTEDDGFDVFINCCAIALEKELSNYVDGPTFGADKNPSKKYKEYLEDCLDMDTIYKVIEVCAGMKLNDPKLLEATADLMREAGTI